MTQFAKIHINNLSDFNLKPALCEPDLNEVSCDEIIEPAQSYTDEDIKAAYSQGFEAGARAGTADTQEKMSRDNTHIHNLLLQNLEQQLNDHHHEFAILIEDYHHRFIDQMTQFFAAALGQLNAENLKNNLDHLIQDIKQKATQAAQAIPSLCVFIHPEDKKLFSTSVTKIIKNTLKETEIKILPRAELARGDIIIEWHDGSLSHQLSRGQEQLTMIIDALPKPKLMPERSARSKGTAHDKK